MEEWKFMLVDMWLDQGLSGRDPALSKFVGDNPPTEEVLSAIKALNLSKEELSDCSSGEMDNVGGKKVIINHKTGNPYDWCNRPEFEVLDAALGKAALNLLGVDYAL